MRCELSSDGEPDFDKKINRFQRICGTIRKHLQKTRTESQMKFHKVIARPTLLYGSENVGNHETRHDSSRSCRDALSKKCQRIHKTRQNKKRSHKKRTRDLWVTRRESQMQTKLDQPSWKNWQQQTSEKRPQLQASGEKRSWTPQETMPTHRCRNRSSDLIHGGRWWWWW